MTREEEPVAGGRKGPRPGGRSARVQAAVHQAVRDIQREAGREELTVPAIAARAGVTPSTIYRRWGDLSQLLSDVALERLRPDGAPADTGSFRSDMEAWLAQYIDEMSSAFGRSVLRDLVGGQTSVNAGECACALREQFEVIRERAARRGESPPDSEALMDHVFAPLVYRLLFAGEDVSFGFAQGLLERLRPAGETPHGHKDGSLPGNSARVS
ncbi:TetR/AcrR family transcriptional regulator [Afifella sp. H1R]|uniref:TetR/AcrR family transcriptional regulator n=1 Tax=Afifella sp. H1R TaxID=2908841 RepID=UPI001F195D3D|nr:TetR/AcrR family transcriptional regulator [Afifella sp. H1R]MCF1504327.1 TetR/AcrR family transcriptional regulator [Afifella sp. H1R]